MNGYRTAFFLFALGVAIIVASVTTITRTDTWRVSNDAPAATIGLAQHHEPLDRAPGEPLKD